VRPVLIDHRENEEFIDPFRQIGLHPTPYKESLHKESLYNEDVERKPPVKKPPADAYL